MITPFILHPPEKRNVVSFMMEELEGEKGPMLSEASYKGLNPIHDGRNPHVLTTSQRPPLLVLLCWTLCFNARIFEKTHSNHSILCESERGGRGPLVSSILDKEYSIYTMDLIPCFSDNKVWL
jgi:hypothetical protein